MTGRMHKYRMIFMGSPDFAVPALTTLYNQKNIEVVACYTQPPKPARRGHKHRKTAIHQQAERYNIPVHTPITLKDSQAVEVLRQMKPDAILVAAYGLILPRDIITLPRFGCLNIHASLLPRWRGAAPIQRAILAGDTVSGITLMKMDVGLDDGDILRQSTCPILPEMTAGQLHDQLAQLGADMLPDFLADWFAGHIIPQPQNHQEANYAAKITSNEGWIDWHHPAQNILNQIRALGVWPGMRFAYQDEVIFLRQAVLAEVKQLPSSQAKTPGTILTPQLHIQTGAGILQPQILQRAGRKACPVPDFLRGFVLPPGAILQGQPLPNRTP